MVGIPTKGMSKDEKDIRLNVMRHLGAQLKLQSTNFKQVQRKFLSDLDQHDNVAGEFFPEDNKSSLGPLGGDDLSFEEQQKLQELKELGDKRHEEIIRVAQSIHELAQMFSELNQLVIEQGTVLDRIDYNLDQARIRVESGAKILVKAEIISRKAHSLKCIICLSVVVIIMLTILILKHSNNSSSS